MASSEGSKSSKGSDKITKISTEDDKVDWVMTGIEVNAYLSRFPESYVQALKEVQSKDPDERAAQIEALGQVYRTVYSLLVEMCGPNTTAMLQVRAHAISDSTLNPNNLWRMIEDRFTQERFNKVQGYLNQIGVFEFKSNEDNKVFIDHFRKLVDDVRSIDEKQVPTDLNLMGVLKTAMLKDKVLWGNLQFNQSTMTLSHMIDTISKWNPEETKTSSAVANYSALSGNLKKAHAKKQSSGRGSGKDKIGRAVVETRACLACKKVGHLVRDCRNKEAKESWLAPRGQ